MNGISKELADELTELLLLKLKEREGENFKYCTPIGKRYSDSLMSAGGKWFIWYNDKNNSSGIVSMEVGTAK